MGESTTCDEDLSTLLRFLTIVILCFSLRKIQQDQTKQNKKHINYKNNWQKIQ